MNPYESPRDTSAPRKRLRVKVSVADLILVFFVVPGTFFMSYLGIKSCLNLLKYEIIVPCFGLVFLSAMSLGAVYLTALAIWHSVSWEKAT